MEPYVKALAQLARELNVAEVSALVPISFNEDASVMATALITVRIKGAPVPIVVTPLDLSIDAGEAVIVALSQFATHPDKALRIVSINGELEHGEVHHTDDQFTYTADADVLGDVVETFEVEVDFLT